MIAKNDLLKLLEKEYATTLRMLRAFPAGKENFRPHERSQEAIRLASTFVFEMYLNKMHLFGESLDRSLFQNYRPAAMSVAIRDFERETGEMIARLAAAPEENLQKTIEFAGAKFRGDEFALMMLHDQIHHRGQLSVYVRMAGGKVPSIYGPSADDSSTNL